VDVLVIGAGPYGLSCAAHLRSVGLQTHVVGTPMEFWRDHMPAGMQLASSWEASTIASPNGVWSLDAFEAERGERIPRPIPLSDFHDYASWYQEEAVVGIDQRRVVRLQQRDGGFKLTFDSGPSLTAPRVIVATGLRGFERRLHVFASLPPELVRHSADLCNLHEFAGRSVAVIGSGQSAIESAVLLSEAGVTVEVIARAKRVRWLKRSKILHEHSGPLRRLLYPPTDVGPPVLNWIVAKPDVFTSLPLKTQARVAYRSIRPAASSWLAPRAGAIRMSLGCKVTRAVAEDGVVLVDTDDGSRRRVDRVVMATGFEIDIRRHPLLPPAVSARLETRGGYPLLRDGFESSLPGLHFVGAYAAESVGPVTRFVAGTHFTAARLLAALAPERGPSRRIVQPPVVATREEA
jgi:cation diffusion facilitator CzcD-associated flavoprotein CzcO